MRKKLHTGIFLETKKFENNKKYYFLSTPKISLIIPKLNNKYLVISQKRIPVNCVTYEFPGGLVDNGKNSLKTAVNELKEETGFVALKKPKKLLSIFPDPGRLNCIYDCYYIDKIKRNNSTEKGIKLHFFSKGEIYKLIKNGKFRHSCHISAFLFLNNQNKYLSDK